MNKRLSALYDKIPPGVGVIDVGTDHGYLPAALAAYGYPGRIFASDIRIEPLRAAKKTAARAGVSERIEFLLCDGLALCPPDAVDTIVIAGMGGDTIVKILDEAEFCMDSRYLLILQPMTKPEVLRYWLAYNEFEILSEALVRETGGLYRLALEQLENRLSKALAGMQGREEDSPRLKLIREVDKQAKELRKTV